VSSRAQALLLSALVGASLAAPARAHAETAELRLEGGAYVGLPFTVDVTAEGFDETPPPAQPPLAIAGATVTPLGVEPSVQQSITIVNGNRTESRRVTFVFRYRVQASRAGTYRIPSVTVSQGSKRARAEGGSVTVADVPSSADMRIALLLPDRPLSVGESAPFELQWLLRLNASDQTLSVPLFDMPDEVQVAPAAAAGRRTFDFSAGRRTLSLPYDRDVVTLGGAQFTRFRFQGLLTPLEEGALRIPPATVVARLQTGVTTDRFGFPTARTELFRTSDVAHTLTVKALPLSGRPASFSGAVGNAFSIAVQASRSVVSLGEPVALTITIRSRGRLDGLSLPRLDGPGGLPKDLFSVPGDAPVGELSEDGKQKTFEVNVRVVGRATQIPPIAFSYFDANKDAYVTVKSQPIALSVRGGAIVGADEVVSSVPSPAPERPRGSPRGSGAPEGGAEVSLVGADLSLSAESGAPRAVLSMAAVRPVLATLYLVPLLLLAARLWQVRTRGRRGEVSALRAARVKVDEALARATTAPGREAAGALAGALRELARAGGVALAGAAARLLERIETDGFSPEAARKPLPAGLREEARALADRLHARGRDGGRRGAAAVLLLALAVTARAAAPEPDASLRDARQAYHRALGEDDPARRRADFRRAAGGFAEALASHPGSPDLCVDWGNASLGAGDVGTATVAYRRALRLDPGDERAARNLSWLRSHLPEWLPRPPTQGAVDALFFWHHAWTRVTRHLVGAVAFALAALLVTPWPLAAGRRRLLRRLAVAPGLVWLAMATSLVLERSAAGDAVVVQGGITLRAADSAGAPAALSSPLPAGAEVSVVERREGWSRVRLSTGVAGWLPDAALESVEVGPAPRAPP
jgi:hypothetical protein